jgi:hypothetical protein
VGRIELNATDEKQVRTLYDFIETVKPYRLALIITRDNELILRPIVATRLDSVLMRNCGLDLRNKILNRLNGTITIYVCDKFRWSEDVHTNAG